ncbi:MAG: hypothetical protein GY861_25340 [bacterium]|nr:hypothetical protein [bacterium]
MTRPYDPNIDKFYYPDDTPELYLTEEQVENILKKIPAFTTPEEEDARMEIQGIERAHRMKCTSSITHKEYLKKCKNISNKFLKKHGFWAWETKTVKEFYNTLNMK